MSCLAIRRFQQAPIAPIGLMIRAAILWALACAPLAAAATPLFFTGPTNAEGFVLGISEQDALTSGLLIIAAPEKVSGANLSIANSTVGGSEYVTQSASGATQEYQITNSGWDVAIGDEFYLIFESMDDAVVNGFHHEYDPATVGMNVVGPDWFLVSYFDDVLAQTLYFPTVSLGSLAMGDSTSILFDFVLTDPVTYVSLEGPVTVTLMLPQMIYSAAFVPVPEPATGLMVSLGLGGLAWSGRKRTCRRV